GGHRDGLLLHVGEQAEAEQERKYSPANANVGRRGLVNHEGHASGFCCSRSQLRQICTASLNDPAALSALRIVSAAGSGCNNNPGKKTVTRIAPGKRRRISAAAESARSRSALGKALTR